MTRVLGRVDAIADGASKSYRPAQGGFTGLFGVRQCEDVMIYVNACPHLGVALDWAPDRFLSSDGAYIVCSMHGATFDIASGLCLRGPCAGDSLEAVPFEIVAGEIVVDEAAGL
jgi:nitrite reductase/ring-hydroxylating ferredoxin subunit